ncbi:hypothetical protein U27_00384 [Candidatus Vecturithrix granuli]|uniref:L-fucose isomerase-like protein n=1 Tax=Vecturithrix granuli TaxID=1499967 RepID=A0A081C7D2_VECG1|nr:hypothetical protein U27_00384 [Candidatus Vecturithrix granuli]
MKARLAPMYFLSGRNEGFDTQIERLKNLLSDEAEILAPVALGSALPEAEAVVFPQILGDAYRQVKDFQQIDLPILIITSEFGTVSMWDWEIASYLKAEGVAAISAYNLDLTKKACKSLAVKRELQQTKFLVFQDNPGEGFQPEIFKCFYWWEDECTQRIKDNFGVTIVKKSFKEFGAQAKEISDQEAQEVWKQWKHLPLEGLSQRALDSAVKVYIAAKREIEQDSSIRAIGINCLNESHFSDSTPCLAWNMLFEEKGIIWGCEADTLMMLTKYVLNKALDVPVMMTNLYPFLMGQAALKHEGIPNFPKVSAEPENHVLVAHCGYLGVVPRPFCTEWTVRPKALKIVDENAIVLDARLPEGPMTLAKLDATMSKIMSIEGLLEGYVQYPGSDCRNGAILKVPDGDALMNRLYSHHYCLMTGHRSIEIGMLAKVFGFDHETI